MSRRHYQVIILGSSLAGRLAGALLAKKGVRVLACGGGDSTESGWFQSSSLLERILEDLAGRSIYSAPVPFQLVAGDSRLDFQGDSPLEEELRREFPASHPRAAAVLRRLATIGEQLEDLLWEGKTLPLFGVGSRFAFSWQMMRRGLGRTLRQSLCDFLAGIAGDRALPVMNGLFAGLSLIPAERLSVAEGAILWSACTRHRTLVRGDLDGLLRQRFAQFHGEETDFDEIADVWLTGGTTGIRLHDGAEYSADHLLLGSREAVSRLPEAARCRISPLLPPPAFTADIPKAAISPMLAPRIILPDPPALRLELSARGEEVRCHVESGRTGDPPLDANALRRRLAHIFPFADLDLVRQHEGNPHPPPQTRTAFPGASGPLRLDRRLLLCHGASAFPSLGSAGEILTGYNVAGYLLSRKK